MPSPFPGMDPYLENPDLWQGFHNRFITYACDRIQRQLPPGYVATLEVRIYLDREAGNGKGEVRIPDVEVFRAAPGRPAGTALLEPELRGHWIPAPEVQHREAYINIQALDGHVVVTTIELLSPSNKQSSRGRQEYLRKQEETIDAGINLVEVDLLRGGAHTVAPPQEILRTLEPHSYVTSIYHAARQGYQVFTWSLADPLPEIPIPLDTPNSAVSLPLGDVFTQTYDNGRFDRLLRYDRPAAVPLTEEESVWAEALLRETGQTKAVGGEEA